MSDQDFAPSSKKIAKNVSFFTIALTLQKVFAFVYFTLIARWIGPQDIGKYVFAVSITTIASVFIDLGLTQVLIREASKFKDKANQYLNTILAAKVLFSVLTYLGVFIAINLLAKDAITTTMVYIAGAVMIVDSFSITLWGIFRGHQILKFEALSIIVNQILIIAVGLGGIYLGFPIYVLVLGLLAGSLFSLILAIVLLKTKLKYSFRLTLERPVFGMLFRIAVPFALAAIFTRVYSYIDQVLLSTLVGDTELGYYSAAYKLTFALQFVPMAFAAGIFPAMSHYFQYDKQKLRNLFEKTMYFLMIISIPIAFGTTIIAKDLIQTLFTTTYNESILTLQILIFAIVAIFLSFPVGSMLNSCNKQHINTINLGITMTLNIILNVILIPQYAHIGAAIAAVVSLFYMFLANLYFVKTITPYNARYLWKKFFITLLSSGLMGVTVYYANQLTNFVVAIMLGIIVYAIFMLIFGGIKKGEVSFIVNSLLKRSS